MEKSLIKQTPFRVGDVVLVVFPFSDLKGKKLRPALVAATAEFGNLILCQITSKSYSSRIAIPIKAADFKTGELLLLSYVRPDKIFTADSSIITRKVGELTLKKKLEILKKLQKMFS